MSEHKSKLQLFPKTQLETLWATLASTDTPASNTQEAACAGPGGRSSPEHQHLDGDTEPPDGMKSQGGDDMGEKAGTKLGGMLGDI